MIFFYKIDIRILIKAFFGRCIIYYYFDKGRKSEMKKAMKQSTIILILNVISVILLLGCVATFILTAYVTEQVNQANVDRFDLTYNANRFMDGSAYLTNEVRAYATTGNTEHYDNYWDEVNNKKNRDIGISKMKEIGITDSEQDMIDEMSALSNKLVPLEEEAMQNVQKGNMEEAVNYVYGTDYSEEIAKINQIKSDFLSELDKRAAAEVEWRIGQNKIISLLEMIFIGLIIILQVVTNRVTKSQLIHPVILIEEEMYKISQGNIKGDFAMEPDTSEIGGLVAAIHHTKKELQKYISDITVKLEEMAAGNMNQSVQLKYVGDFAPIHDALVTILDSMNHTLSQISRAAVQVDGSSEQVSSGAQALSQGATEQASSVEELSATVNELTGDMGHIAESADNAKKISLQAENVLEICNEKMHDMQQAMKKMSDASGEIGKIINTIEDIASQTNILALNAAVEAARAGTAGKGFAVVADEVRNLANKSKEASKQTEALIENSIKAVEVGVKLAEDTRRTLEQVVEGTRTSSELVEKIAAASGRQADALSQVSMGLNQIAGVVQNTSATAEESAATSEELSSQAGQMKQLVEAFRLSVE